MSIWDGNRFLRGTFFKRDVSVPNDFTGDVLIAPALSETYEHGIPVMTNACHSEHLDAAIDAALDGVTTGLYPSLEKKP